MTRDDIRKILSLHGVDDGWLHQKVNISSEESIITALNRSSRVTAALRDIVEAADKESA